MAKDNRLLTQIQIICNHVVPCFVFAAQEHILPVSTNQNCGFNRAGFCIVAAFAVICLTISACSDDQNGSDEGDEDIGLDTGVEGDTSDADDSLDASDEDSSTPIDASDAEGESESDDIATDVDDTDAESDVGDGGDVDADADAPLYVEGDPPQGMDGLEILGADEEDEQMQPLLQGEVLTWEQGLQGGFHFWGGFRATGGVFENWSDATDEELNSLVQHYEIFDGEGELLATTNRIGFVERIDDGIAASTRFTVILRRSIDPEDTVDDGPFEFVLGLEMPDDEIYETRVWTYFDCCHFL